MNPVMSASSSRLRTAKRPLVEAARFLRHSRSLASMLPSLVTTSFITLLVSGIERLMWVGVGHNFFKAWMESWLTAWPIAFPIVYLAVVVSLAARFIAPAVAPTPARDGTAAVREPAGLALSGIEDGSARTTAKNGPRVRRKPHRSFEVA